MKTYLTFAVSILTLTAYSQKGNNDVAKGNKAYHDNDYKAAASEYTKALVKEPGNIPAKFNLGNVQLRQKNAGEANKQYDDVLNSTADAALRSKALYNKGLSFIKQQNLDEAIKAFKQSLGLAPDDNEIRENLQKALNEKRQQQQSQQKNAPQPPKEKPKPQQNQKPLNKQMMQQKFNELRNQEKQLQKKLQQKPSEGQPEKDW